MGAMTSAALPFWLIVAALTLFAGATLWRAGRKALPGRADADMRLYRDQLAEVERDLARGTVTAGEAVLARHVMGDSSLGSRDSQGVVDATSVICAPIRRGSRIMGLLHLYSTSDQRVPELACACVAALGAHMGRLKAQILEFDRRIMAWHRSNETSRRLDAIPGIGPALATALVASVVDPKAFRSGRNFSAWIGLVPKQHSSGGKDKLGSISKQGDRYLRSLFTAGALAVIRYAKLHGTKHRPWLTALLARRPTKVAAIALANKIARMAWAVMAKGERYKEPAALAA